MEKKIRKRSPNWDDAERALLKQCIGNFMDIVENKCTDTNTNKEKKLAWLKISQRFNKYNIRQRTVPEIKQQWRTLKIEAKKCNLDYSKEANTTDGEPPSLDPTSKRVLELLPLELVENNYAYDSDSITEESDTPVSSKKRASLQTSFNGRKRCKIEENSSILELVRPKNTEEMECLQRESDLKIQQMVEVHEWAREKHNMEIEHLKIKNQLEIEHLKLRNQLLQKQISENNT